MGIASLSVFGGTVVLAKVRRGVISVRCLELTIVCFSVYDKINRRQASHPLYSGCPLFGRFVIRRFIVCKKALIGRGEGERRRKFLRAGEQFECWKQGCLVWGGEGSRRIPPEKSHRL